MPRFAICSVLAVLLALCPAPLTAQTAGEAASTATDQALEGQPDLPLDLKGEPNPDSEHVTGTAGAETVRLTPRGDALDFPNLQWAVDNVAPGGTVELGAGTFFLGDGKAAPKRTVFLRHGLRLLGEKEGDEWRTVVRGGGAPGCGPVGYPNTSSQGESGPFRITNASDPHPVVFENLWLREWTAEAVCIDATRGFVLRGCRLSHPVNTTMDGAIRFVHALWTTGSDARGDFIAEHNLVELGTYDGPLADDEQFLGVFYSNHDTVRVSDNVITGIDEAIEIIGNRVDRSARGGEPGASGPAEVIVTGNRIDVTQQPGERWPSTFAILVAGNNNAERVRIENNELTVRGKGFAFGLSGDRMSITGNRVRFEEFQGSYPAGVATIGFGQLAGLPMGSSLNDSVFAGNTFEGKVSELGIQFRPVNGDAKNDSHGNRFDLGDSLAKLGAPTTISLTKDVHDNTFTGDVGKVVSEAPDGANRY